MLDSADHARAWMLKGDSDLLTVRHLLDTNGPYDTACFHAQQAAEKYLKALLALTGRPIPLIHNLEELDRACAAIIPGWQRVGVDLAQLTTYAVQARYDLAFLPDRATVMDALQDAEQVRVVVIVALPERARP